MFYNHDSLLQYSLSRFNKKCWFIQEQWMFVLHHYSAVHHAFFYSNTLTSLLGLLIKQFDLNDLNILFQIKQVCEHNCSHICINAFL